METQTRTGARMTEPEAIEAITVQQKDVIRFDEGILGFPDSHRYILIPHETNSPFAWLQSVDEENLAFLLVNPVCVKPDYLVQLPMNAADDLRLTDASKGVVFAIVVVPEDPRKMRMNLRAPVIINFDKKLGRQVVLEDASLDLRYPLLSDEDQAKDC